VSIDVLLAKAARKGVVLSVLPPEVEIGPSPRIRLVAPRGHSFGGGERVGMILIDLLLDPPAPTPALAAAEIQGAVEAWLDSLSRD
jgi:hypothetical protein